MGVSSKDVFERLKAQPSAGDEPADDLGEGPEDTDEGLDLDALLRSAIDNEGPEDSEDEGEPASAGSEAPEGDGDEPEPEGAEDVDEYHDSESEGDTESEEDGDVSPEPEEDPRVAQLQAQLAELQALTRQLVEERRQAQQQPGPAQRAQQARPYPSEVHEAARDLFMGRVEEVKKLPASVQRAAVAAQDDMINRQLHQALDPEGYYAQNVQSLVQRQIDAAIAPIHQRAQADAAHAALAGYERRIKDEKNRQRFYQLVGQVSGTPEERLERAWGFYQAERKAGGEAKNKQRAQTRARQDEANRVARRGGKRSDGKGRRAAPRLPDFEDYEVDDPVAFARRLTEQGGLS